MAIVQPYGKTTEGPLFNSLDALDTLFEKVFAPRLVTSPLPTLAYLSDQESRMMQERPSNPTPNGRPVPVPVPKTDTNPYAVFRPSGSAGPKQYASSLDSPLFSSPEPLKSPNIEKMWNDGARQLNRSTLTSVSRKDTPKMKKKRSRLNFRESSDSNTITATFDLPGILKEDVHVSYQQDRLTVTWQYVKVTEKEEDNKIVRERKEKKYIRTVNLPEGTDFEDVKATMDGRRLTLTYPKTGSSRAVPIHKTD